MLKDHLWETLACKFRPTACYGDTTLTFSSNRSNSWRAFWLVSSKYVWSFFHYTNKQAQYQKVLERNTYRSVPQSGHWLHLGMFPRKFIFLFSPPHLSSVVCVSWVPIFRWLTFSMLLWMVYKHFIGFPFPQSVFPVLFFCTRISNTLVLHMHKPQVILLFWPNSSQLPPVLRKQSY